MKKRIEVFICTGIIVILFIFFLNEDFVLSCDIKLHYDFAQNIPLLYQNGKEWFYDNVKYAHVLSYPGWHYVYLTSYYICEKLAISGVVACESLMILASAVVNTLFMVITSLITSYGLKSCMNISKRVALAISGIMLFVGPIYLPRVTDKYYLGQFTANAWHNPTTIAVEPFALIALFLFYNIRKRKEEINSKATNRMLILFSAVLLVSAFFKPSFYQSFVPAVIVYIIVEIIIHKSTDIYLNLKCIMAVIPVCLLALTQYSISFVSTSNGIIIRPFEVWLLFSRNIPASFICSFLFPLIVGILALRDSKRKEEVKISSWYILSALSQFIIFSFKESAGTGDFVWGVYLATYVLFMTAIVIMVDYIKEKGYNMRAKVMTVSLFLHLICGIGYFISIFVIGSFYLEY